eukprot:scaffold3190_cov409-Prasinococcus_capsulatus_cf.AAC.14
MTLPSCSACCCCCCASEAPKRRAGAPGPGEREVAPLHNSGPVCAPIWPTPPWRVRMRLRSPGPEWARAATSGTAVRSRDGHATFPGTGGSEFDATHDCGTCDMRRQWTLRKTFAALPPGQLGATQLEDQAQASLGLGVTDDPVLRGGDPALALGIQHFSG